jgi:catechol 2,3-dioxygenase-like lactoylglutathione lyase family enzyme
MKFVSVRIITNDLERLVDFYERVTGAAAVKYTPDFVELVTPAATLALASTRTLQFFSGEIARPADNHTAILEFIVDDVDADYRRLEGTIDLVQPPTTMPWGNRSLLFRDPDGNLVNLFTKVTPAANQTLAQ